MRAASGPPRRAARTDGLSLPAFINRSLGLAEPAEVSALLEGDRPFI
jgi:hypothetical protein